MADYYWPQDIVPSTQSWKIIDPTAIFRSPFTSATRRFSRPGLMLGCSVTVRSLNTSQRHRMISLLAALRGRGQSLWLPDFTTVQRGSFPASELLQNTTFPSTNGWTSNNAEMVLTSDSGRMRLSRTGVVADRVASSPATTVTGAKYLFRAGMLGGLGNLRYSLNMGTVAGATDIVAGSTLTAAGMNYVTAAATGTLSFPGIKDFISGRSAGNFQFLDSPSFARCALVNGASQTGNALSIAGLPVSTVGLLLAGDLVAVYTNQWEMKRLTFDLNSDSGGNGYMVFEPPLRISPADQSPIAIWRPTARFLLSDDASWDTVPGLFSDFSIDLVEDVS
jgi:hypothetical protein